MVLHAQSLSCAECNNAKQQKRFLLHSSAIFTRRHSTAASTNEQTFYTVPLFSLDHTQQQPQHFTDSSEHIGDNYYSYNEKENFAFCSRKHFLRWLSLSRKPITSPHILGSSITAFWKKFTRSQIYAANLRASRAAFSH